MMALLTGDKNSYEDTYSRIIDLFYKKSAIIHKNFPLISNLSVIENITLPASYHKKSDISHYISKVSEDMAFLGFGEKINSRKNELSDFENLCVRTMQGLYSELREIIIFGELSKFGNSELNKLFNFLYKEKSENILFIDYNEMKGFFETVNIKIIKKVEEWTTRNSKI